MSQVSTKASRDPLGGHSSEVTPPDDTDDADDDNGQQHGSPSENGRCRDILALIENRQYHLVDDLAQRDGAGDGAGCEDGATEHGDRKWHPMGAHETADELDRLDYSRIRHPATLAVLGEPPP